MPPNRRGRKPAAATKAAAARGAAGAGAAPVPVTRARGGNRKGKGKGKKKRVQVGVDAPAASANILTTTTQKRTRTVGARGRGRGPEAGCGDGPVVPAGSVKRGCRILFSGQFSGKGMSAEEWREWLAWMEDGQERTVYHRYEAVGNPTEKGLDPTKERYVWEIETGEWVKKGAGRPAPVEEEEEQVEDGEKSPVIGVGGRPKRVRRPPRWYGDF